jgi:hypothetical protein
MPVFRLEPVAQTAESPHWQSSTIGAQRCWVEAADERAARWAVTLATIIARHDDHPDSPIMPWRHADHANCLIERDRIEGLRPGHVLDAEGKLHEIEEYQAARSAQWDTQEL